MILLLFTLILCEMGMLLTLVFETHLRKLAMMALDRLNQQGWGPMTRRAVVGVLLAVFVSSVYSIMKTHRRTIDGGSVDPMGEVLVANQMLIAFLVGFLLFFSTMINKLHHVVMEHSSLKKFIIAEEKQLAERKYHDAERLKELEEDVAVLKTVIKKLESEYERKANNANTAAANVMALRKQSEEYELEYDRLLEYNQTLKNQLQSVDESLVKDSQKRGWTSLKSNILREGLVQFPWGIHKSRHSRGELGPEIEVHTTNRSVISLPRHRRPIYQQMSFTL